LGEEPFFLPAKRPPSPTTAVGQVEPGVFPLPAARKVVAMTRSVLTVEPVRNGWIVSLGGRALDVRATKLEAIGVADRMAGERYRRNGDATGVAVRIAGGDSVLIARHGWDGQKSRAGFR